MTKQRILFITTGGTIASVRTQQGLKPVLTSEELLAHLPDLKELCCPETLALCSIDSTDLGQEHWLMMARAIQENYALYDGFIICHGTDTLAYSAAALSYLIQNAECDTKSRNVLCINTALSIWSNPTVTCTGQKPALGSSQDNMGNLPA